MMKKLLIMTVAAVALCAAALPAHARICKDGSESTVGGWCTAAPPEDAFPIFTEAFTDGGIKHYVKHYANCAEGDGFYDLKRHKWRSARPNDPECPSGPN